MILHVHLVQLVPGGLPLVELTGEDRAVQFGALGADFAPA